MPPSSNNRLTHATQILAPTPTDSTIYVNRVMCVTVYPSVNPVAPVFIGAYCRIMVSAGLDAFMCFINVLSFANTYSTSKNNNTLSTNLCLL